MSRIPVLAFPAEGGAFDAEPVLEDQHGSVLEADRLDAGEAGGHLVRREVGGDVKDGVGGTPQKHVAHRAPDQVCLPAAAP